jgi:hypothetical protein
MSLTIVVTIIFFGLIFFDGGPQAYSQQEFNIQGNIPPIRTTYPELKLFVNQLEELVKRSIKPREGIGGYENFPITYEIGSEDIKITYTSIEDLLQDPRLPSPAYQLTITKFGIKDPISFYIYFEPSNSHYRLTGSDFAVVDAVQKHIEAFGRTNESFVGNTIIPILFFLAVFGSIIVMPAFISAIIVDKGIKIFRKRTIENEDAKNFHSGIFMLLLVPLYFIIGTLSLIYGLNFLYRTKRTWFSDTKIYPHTANFLELYGAEISFISLLVGIFGLIFAFYSRSRKLLPSNNPEIKER